MQTGAMMGGWMLLWGLLALALLVLAVVATVWLVKSLSSGPQAPDQAEEELRRRRAAGEIDREDYLRRKEDVASR